MTGSILGSSDTVLLCRALFHISPTTSPLSRNPLSQKMGSKLGTREWKEASVLAALFPSQGLLGGGPLGQHLLAFGLVLGSLGQVWI